MYYLLWPVQKGSSSLKSIVVLLSSLTQISKRACNHLNIGAAAAAAKTVNAIKVTFHKMAQQLLNNDA